MARKFWAHFKVGRSKHRLGPFATRDDAVEAAKKVSEIGPAIRRKSLSTGYGSEAAWFDIRWHDDIGN